MIITSPNQSLSPSDLTSQSKQATSRQDIDAAENDFNAMMSTPTTKLLEASLEKLDNSLRQLAKYPEDPTNKIEAQISLRSLYDNSEAMKELPGYNPNPKLDDVIRLANQVARYPDDPTNYIELQISLDELKRSGSL